MSNELKAVGKEIMEVIAKNGMSVDTARYLLNKCIKELDYTVYTISEADEDGYVFGWDDPLDKLYD